MPPGEIPAINARTLSLNMITFYWSCGDFTKVFQKFYKGSGKRFYMRKIRSTASMVTNYSEKSNINFAIIKGKLCCILLFFPMFKFKLLGSIYIPTRTEKSTFDNACSSTP